MPSSPPTLIAIDHDDYHAEYVGKAADGRQFFLTTPFEPAMNESEGCEYVALYLFDDAGVLVDAKVESFGPRQTAKEDDIQRAIEGLLRSLGDISYERIEVAPFSIERFGTTFGLVLRTPDEDGDPWAVEVQPGNYMAFFEPWDSGDYDT